MKPAVELNKIQGGEGVPFYEPELELGEKLRQATKNIDVISFNKLLVELWETPTIDSMIEKLNYFIIKKKEKHKNWDKNKFYK